MRVSGAGADFGGIGDIGSLLVREPYKLSPSFAITPKVCTKWGQINLKKPLNGVNPSPVVRLALLADYCRVSGPSASKCEHSRPFIFPRLEIALALSANRQISSPHSIRLHFGRFCAWTCCLPRWASIDSIAAVPGSGLADGFQHVLRLSVSFHVSGTGVSQVAFST